MTRVVRYSNSRAVGCLRVRRPAARPIVIVNSGPATVEVVSDSSSAFFVADGPALIPQKWATSHWSESMLSGPPVCGSLARALEREYGRPELQPARLTVDMFKPVRNRPLQIATTLVRDGNRIRAS